jgi:multisubunit Na+/H+ antiporter MnhC subunit
MSLDSAAFLAQCAVALALFAMGAAALLTASSVGKRIMALAAINAAALYALAAMGAPQGALIAASVAGFAQIGLGVALMVRLKEDYGAVEVSDLDLADAQSERTDQT